MFELIAKLFALIAAYEEAVGAYSVLSGTAEGCDVLARSFALFNEIYDLKIMMGQLARAKRLPPGQWKNLHEAVHVYINHRDTRAYTKSGSTGTVAATTSTSVSVTVIAGSGSPATSASRPNSLNTPVGEKGSP